jgi:hypothetical protein
MESSTGSADEVIDAQCRLEKVSSSVSSMGSVCSEEGAVSDSGAGDGSDLGPITMMVPATVGDGSDPAVSVSLSDSGAGDGSDPGPITLMVPSPAGSSRFCDSNSFGLANSYISILDASDSRLVAEESSSIADECSSSSDILMSVRPWFAESEFIGDAIVAKPLAVSARKDSQAWFFGVVES